MLLRNTCGLRPARGDSPSNRPALTFEVHREEEPLQQEGDPNEGEEQNLSKDFVSKDVVPDENEEEAEPAGSAFECTVSKQGPSDWGWVLDYWDDACQVTKVGAGSISEYNASVQEDRRILEFDLLTQVNRAKTSRGMRDEIKASETLTLKVLRPATLTVNISREGHPWGVEVSYRAKSSGCLRVMNVGEGAVALESRKRSWPVLRPNDFIIRINEGLGTPQALLEQWKVASTAEMVVLRMPPNAESQVWH